MHTVVCCRDDSSVDSNLWKGGLFVIVFFIVISCLAFPNGRIYLYVVGSMLKFGAVVALIDSTCYKNY